MTKYIVILATTLLATLLLNARGAENSDEWYDHTGYNRMPLQNTDPESFGNLKPGLMTTDEIMQDIDRMQWELLSDLTAEIRSLKKEKSDLGKKLDLLIVSGIIILSIAVGKIFTRLLVGER